MAPRQLRDLTLGAHRLQFVYQEPEAFAACNEPALLEAIKAPAGFAVVAGVELTLLDCVRYMHRTGGVNSLAQVAKDLGSEADTRKLSKAATHCEGAAVRRLGYLLEQAGQGKQARALHSNAESARHSAPLDLGVKPLFPALAESSRREPTWKLELNETIEVAMRSGELCGWHATDGACEGFFDGRLVSHGDGA